MPPKKKKMVEAQTGPETKKDKKKKKGKSERCFDIAPPILSFPFHSYGPISRLPRPTFARE